VLSWASGSNPWGPERDDQFMRPTHYDGMLEVVGVSGVAHMGQITSGLRSATRIAQGGHVSTRSWLADSVHRFDQLQFWNFPRTIFDRIIIQLLVLFNATHEAIGCF